MKIIDNILDVERNIEGIDAVIFDLDDTLFPEKEYIMSGFFAIENYLQLQGIAKELWNCFEHGKTPIDTVLSNHGLLKVKDDVLKIYRFHSPKIRLYPGVEEMLGRLQQKIGIITDGRPEGQRAKITSLGLMVDEVIITDELGGIEYRKPNDKAFRIMAEKLSVPFQRMVYVGDNINKDFVAPTSLGMQTIWFRNEDGIYYR